MNVFTVIGIVVISVALFSLVLAGLLYRANLAVVRSQEEVDKAKKRYQPATTLGFQIPTDEDKDVQLIEARREAAKIAARMPRGANMRIGRKGASNLQTASKNLKRDPISALKIAEVQGWRGLGEFEELQAAATQAVAAPKTAGKKVKRKLVPGKDYPVTKITDDMDGAERRQARIANAKAKTNAMKELKAAGADMVAAPTAAPQARPPAAPSGPTAADVGIEEPELIEITDDMDPAAIRKARIANAKAMSAYKKALKAAGVDLSSAGGPADTPPPQQQAPAAAPSGPTAADVGIEEPELIEITDDMDPAAIRKARIANAKAMSAYKKALKEAGVDLSAASEPAAASQAAPPAPAAEEPAKVAAPSDIPKPDLVEITDDMDPSKVRQARIANAKAMSAYKKALKEAGIDPSTVDI